MAKMLALSILIPFYYQYLVECLTYSRQLVTAMVANIIKLMSYEIGAIILILHIKR